jgi:HEAT repeat protein
MAALEASDAANDAALRYEAILALGKLRALQAVGPIMKRVADPKKTDLDQLVASAALEALVMLGARGAVEPIAAALDNEAVDEWGPFPDWTVSQLAVWALERMVAESEWPRLGQAIADAKDETARRSLVSDWRAWRNNKGAREETRAAIAKVVEAIEAHRKDTGKLPAELKALVSGEKKYLPGEEALKDGWKEPFEYLVPGWGADYSLLRNHEGWEKVGADLTAERLRAIAKALEAAKAKGGLPLDLGKLKDSGDYAGALVDGWGGAFVYKVSADGTTYTLKSHGYDGKELGEGADKDVDVKDLPK